MSDRKWLLTMWGALLVLAFIIGCTLIFRPNPIEATEYSGTLLQTANLKFSSKSQICVVMTSPGYFLFDGREQISGVLSDKPLGWSDKYFYLYEQCVLSGSYEVDNAAENVLFTIRSKTPLTIVIGDQQIGYFRSMLGLIVLFFCIGFFGTSGLNNLLNKLDKRLAQKVETK